MQNDAGATSQLTEFVEKTRFEDLPAEVVHDTKRLICDSIACAIGGSRIDAGEIMIETTRLLGGPEQSTVFGADFKVSPAAAAFANAYLGNVLDADDTFLHFGHPAVCAVFPALALAEARGVSGKELITAVAVGFETGGRVGMSILWTRPGEERPPDSFSWYIFCAAAGAGKIMNLNKAQLASAFGTAGLTSPVGIMHRWITQGAGRHMLKYSPNGFLAFQGVMAAQLAENGFESDARIFDGDLAYSELLGAYGSSSERMLGELGKKWWIGESSIKPYASGSLSHHSVYLVGKLIKEHQIQPDEIELIAVETGLQRAVNRWFNDVRPKNQIDMQFSLPLAVAATALGSDLGPSWLTPEMVENPKLHALAQKIRVSLNPDSARAIKEQLEQDGGIRRIPHKVTITARGQTFTATTDTAWGDPSNEETKMTDEELKDKFRRYTHGVLQADEAESMLDAIFDLEDVDNVATLARTVA